MQTFSSSFTFYKGGKLNLKTGIALGVPVIFGTVIGAQIATPINHEVFEKILGVVMLSMVLFLF
jgi:uncharacterized membrane protein YfcA